MKSYILIALSMLPVVGYANSDEYSCVQYQRQDYSWSDPYKVPAFVVSGEAMQKATDYDYRYNSYNNYAVVKWPNGGYSALELPSYIDEISYSYREARAQDGRTYRIKEAPSYGQCSSY